MMSDTIEPRVAVLEQIAKSTEAMLARLEAGQPALRAEMGVMRTEMRTGLDRADRRIDDVAREQRSGFDRLDRRMDEVAREHRADFRWLLGLMMGGFTALLATMAHGFHWL